MNREKVRNVLGVPDYTVSELSEKSSDYCILIPVINEGKRIRTEITRAFKYEVYKSVDIVICDGGSTDGSIDEKRFHRLGVNTILIKDGPGKQGAHRGIFPRFCKGTE